MCWKPKPRTSTLRVGCCRKRTCAHPAPRKSRFFRLSPASSARPARNLWLWTSLPPATPCCCWTRPEPTTVKWFAKMRRDMHYTTPMMRLQDPKQTRIPIATLAETTPVLEAANLQNDLRRAGIEPWAWIINQSLAASQKLFAPAAEAGHERTAPDRGGRKPSCFPLRRRCTAKRRAGRCRTPASLGGKPDRGQEFIGALMPPSQQQSNSQE